MTPEAFVYWYVSAFLVLFGTFCIARNRSMMALSRYFRSELKEPALAERLRMVLARRQILEQLPNLTMIAVGASFIIFGVLTLLHVVSPALADALACADCALTFALTFARVRNRSERRAASLTPRRIERVIPLPALIGAAITSILPLTLATLPDLLLPSIIASISALVICAAASITAGMAAVLEGQDVDLELFVDERVRRARACGLLGLSYAIAPVFIAVASPQAASSSVYLVSLGISLALFVPYFAWFLSTLRMRPSKIHGAII